jgi:hypothetical protein
MRMICYGIFNSLLIAFHYISYIRMIITYIVIILINYANLEAKKPLIAKKSLKNRIFNNLI